MNIVFDLDGTLVDSAPDIHAAVAQMLRAEGLAPLDLATVTSFVGNGVPTLVQRVMRHLGLDMADHAQMTRVMLEHYATASTDLTRPYPGVVESLGVLHAAGYRLAICTNKPLAPARTVLADLDLARFFPVVIGGDSMPVVKPDPAPLFAAIAQMGGGPAVFVGDSEVDAATALAAGVPFALFTEGYRKSAVAEISHALAFSDFDGFANLVAGLMPR